MFIYNRACFSREKRDDSTTTVVSFVVGQVGLEPTIVKPADLQSAAMAARRLTHMAERAELESDTLRVRLA